MQRLMMLAGLDSAPGPRREDTIAVARLEVGGQASERARAARLGCPHAGGRALAPITFGRSPAWTSGIRARTRCCRRRAAPGDLLPWAGSGQTRQADAETGSTVRLAERGEKPR